MTHTGWKYVTALVMFLLPASATYGQATPENLKALLSKPVQTTEVTAYQLEQYLRRHNTPLPSPKTASDWTSDEQKLRKHIVEDIAFHGWPSEWVHSAPSFQQVGVIETGHGYRVRKFRYEIVPGFNATALLYEPEKISGRVPAILNVLGHEPMGNAAEYEQKRCINFAKRGIIALSIAWMGYGELALKDNDHDDTGALDLVGANALGLFYLNMRRGLDYLSGLPQVDTIRIGVTGLSGGGWQTILLSATDDRVAVMAEVAGFGALPSNVTHPRETNEIEENATDLNRGEDYPYLVAMRAPRPTLLVHNSEDDCCFRAALVKPYIYDQIRPFFQLYGKPDALRWYESTDPGTHNYQLLNRQQAYAFFDEYFHLSAPSDEIPSSTEIRSPEELAAGVPSDNLTIRSLARKLAEMNTKPAVPPDGDARKTWIAGQRGKLKDVIRYTPVSVQEAARIDNTRRLAMQTLSYRFDFTNGLSASGIWLQAIGASEDAPITIVLNDKGYEASGEVVAKHVNRGEQVIALDLLFNGFTKPQTPDPADWEMLVSSVGDRPLGLEVAQLIGVSNWLRANNNHRQIQIETEGMRTAVISTAAAAIEPDTFSIITNNHALESLGYLLDKPVVFREAPDLFCLDLYKYFDISSIAAIASPTAIKSLEPIH